MGSGLTALVQKGRSYSKYEKIIYIYPRLSVKHSGIDRSSSLCYYVSMQHAPSGRRFPIKLPFIIAAILIIAILIGGGIYLYINNSGVSLPGQAQNQDTDATAEAKELVEKVGRLYELPQNEVPTIATVSDVSKLAEQEFFQKAQNGDKVLIFTQAKKAILYRPSTDKIIEVGPVNLDNQPQLEGENQATESAQTTAGPVRVSLYNGTQTAGLTRRMETQLATFDEVEIEIATRENAAGDHEQTVVVDLSGQNAAAARQIAEFANARVAQLPSGEERPENADILIILGSDFAEAIE